MQVTIKKLDPIRVAFMRHMGPYQDVGATWSKFCTWAGMRGLFGPQTRILGLSYDDPDVTPPDKLRYDACLTVGPQFQPEGEIGVQEIPGGDHAMAVHKGPYEKLGETYAAICGEWLPRSGREVRTAPAIEMYLNNPQDTAPEDLVTEIYVPLNG